MNFALSSLVVLLILLPSLIFRFLLIKADGFENPLDTSLKAEIGLIFIFAILSNLLAVTLIEYLGYIVRIDVFYKILVGTTNENDISLIKSDYKSFLIYVIISSIILGCLALFLKKKIIENYYDIKFSFLTISNEWDTLLSGRLYSYNRIKEIDKKIGKLKNDLKEIKLEIEQYNALPHNMEEEYNTLIKEINSKIELHKMKREEKFLFVKVDALVETDGEDYIYSGKLYKYYLATQNRLDKIILENVSKRKFILKKELVEKDKQNSNFIIFNSDYFVLDYTNIKNLNLTFHYTNYNTLPL